MTRREFQQIIVNRTVSEIKNGTAPNKVDKIAYDNAENKALLTGDEEFIHLVFSHGSSAIRHTTRRYIYAGVIFFNVFVPKQTGSGRAMEICDYIDEVFSGLRGDEFELEGAGVQSFGKLRSLFQYQVSINFTYQRTGQSRLVTLEC